MSARPKWRARYNSTRARSSENVARNLLQYARVRPPSHRAPGVNAPNLVAREGIVRALSRAHSPLVLAGAAQSTLRPGAGTASSAGASWPFCVVRGGRKLGSPRVLDRRPRARIWRPGAGGLPGEAARSTGSGRSGSGRRLAPQGARPDPGPRLSLLLQLIGLSLGARHYQVQGDLLLRRASTECPLPPGGLPNFPLLFPLFLLSQCALSSCTRSRARISNYN